MSQSQAILMEELPRAYDGILALDGLRLRIEHGEVSGFLGPNGATKIAASARAAAIMSWLVLGSFKRGDVFAGRREWDLGQLLERATRRTTSPRSPTSGTH